MVVKNKQCYTFHNSLGFLGGLFYNIFTGQFIFNDAMIP